MRSGPGRTSSGRVRSALVAPGNPAPCIGTGAAAVPPNEMRGPAPEPPPPPAAGCSIPLPPQARAVPSSGAAVPGVVPVQDTVWRCLTEPPAQARAGPASPRPAGVPVIELLILFRTWREGGQAGGFGDCVPQGLLGHALAARRPFGHAHMRCVLKPHHAPERALGPSLHCGSPARGRSSPRHIAGCTWRAHPKRGHARI
jgi:hypothetical protein